MPTQGAGGEADVDAARRRAGARLSLVAIAAAALALTALALLATGAIATPDLAGTLADLSERLGSWTYVLVAALAFLETAAFVGLIAPGETALALGGVVAAHGQADLPVMIAVAWLGAAGGDLTSFLLGRRFGRAALDRHGARIGLSPTRVAHVEGFFTAHGPRAILLGRFIGLVRAVAPFLAGTSELTLRAFLPWSLIGTAAWASLFVTVGYIFSSSFERATGTLTKVALGLALVIAGVLVLRSRRRRRLAPTS